MSARQLTGAQKAAIVLVALGEELAADIFRNLSEREIKQIGSALGRLGPIPPELVEDIVEEFQKNLQQTGKPSLPWGSQARQMLGAALKKARGDGFEELFGSEPSAGLPSLEKIEAKQLAGIIKREHPQTAALILAHCEPRKFADAIKLLPEKLQSELVLRVARLSPVDPEILDQIEESLRAEADKTHTLHRADLGGAAAVASMLNQMDDASRKEFLDDLELRDPEVAEEVRGLLFTFADFVKLSDHHMQELLKHVPAATLQLALKAAPEDVQQKVLSNMSGRAAKMLKEDLEAMPKVALTEVETARRTMIETARRLEEEGRLQLSSDEIYV